MAFHTRLCGSSFFLKFLGRSLDRQPAWNRIFSGNYISKQSSWSDDQDYPMQEKAHHRVTTGGELAVTITHPSRFCNGLDICYLLETYNWLYFPWEVLLFLLKIWIYNFIFLCRTPQIISNLYSVTPPHLTLVESLAFQVQGLRCYLFGNRGTHKMCTNQLPW